MVILEHKEGSLKTILCNQLSTISSPDSVY